MELKENLKELRKNKHLNQDEITKLFTFKTKQTYSSWEQGKSKPNYEQLIVLADFYNISLDELCGRKEKTSDNLSNVEKEIINIIKDLNEQAQLKVLGYLYGLKEADKLVTKANK